tara:strand:+ start:371 stop:502 length:132 start_codon:yes stop_codon:yes gene_type:complete
MSHHQANCEGDKAQITSLSPEPEKKKEEKFDEDISLEEALSTL